MNAECTLERQARDLAAAGYEDWYRESKGVWFDVREKSMFVGAIERAHFSRPLRVLDAGCGTGRLTEAIAPMTASVASLDFSHRSLAVLNSKQLPNANGVEADAGQALPFRSESFDVVVCCQVLQHMPLATLLQIMREFRRVLKEDGRVLLSVYNLGYWRFRDVFECIDASGLYYRRFNRAYIRHLARYAAFQADSIAHYKCLPAHWPLLEGTLGGSTYAGLDQALCSVPVLRSILAEYMLAELRTVPITSCGPPLDI